MTPSDSAPWPTLRSWLGNRSDHPLRALLDGADGASDHAKAVCARWDDLLRLIEQAQPNRWQGKRREFRQQRFLSETFSGRCELVLASWLVRAGVEFEFGQRGQPLPDLVLPEWGLGMEVGSRSLDGAQELEDGIRAIVEHGGKPEHVQITFDNWPLAIRKSVREVIIEMVRLGLEVDEEVVPARGDQPAVHVRITRTPSAEPTVVETSMTNERLTPHFQDVDAEIQASVIRDPRKVDQAKSMPTVLVVDISRCGEAMFRLLPSWTQTLNSILDERDPFAAVAVMATGRDDDIVQYVQLPWAANPHCDPELAERVSQLFSKLGVTG